MAIVPAAADHHVKAYVMAKLGTIATAWRDNYRRSREREWQEAVDRRDATREQMRLGLLNGIRAPLSSSARAFEADEWLSFARLYWRWGMIEKEPYCPIEDALRAGRILDLPA